MSTQDEFIKMTESKRAKIDAIANALKFSTSEPKVAEKKLPDGSNQKVTQITDSSGKQIFSVSKDDKNVMTFTTKKQLMDFLGD
jgi:hypothetical protein